MIKKIVIGTLVCIMLAGIAACDGGDGSGQQATPSPTATVEITRQEAEQVVYTHLQSVANTSHGEQVLAEFWNNSEEKGDYVEEGNWIIRAGIHASYVYNNSLLETVLAGAEEGYYIVEWWVSGNGSEVLNRNWNAKRLEDALQEE